MIFTANQVIPIVPTRDARNMPKKEQKTAWTDGERFRMIFSREMKSEEGNKDGNR